MSSVDDLFHPVIELPKGVRSKRYQRLVGLDATKDRLRRESRLLVDPDRLQQWADQHHELGLPALDLVADRAPLFVFAGDVGVGKTALAESFGCDLADELDLPVFLYRLKLTARGTGLVGEMTTLIGDAFAHLLQAGTKSRTSGRPNAVHILVVDEADALAQSRAAGQMHHEDRAGVDAVLAGVDSLAGAKVPVLVVMCTNRERALDPAVVRRAAATFTFLRPDDDQRRSVLNESLRGTGIPSSAIDELVARTGPTSTQPGYTYSDLTQRLIPSAILMVFPDRPLTAEVLLTTASEIRPTPAFAPTP